MISKDEVNEQSKSAVRQWWPLWTENARVNGEKYRKEGRSHKDLLFSGVGKTMLCVALSPSFEHEIETIKQADRNAVDIACVDKAFPALMDRGIKPNYVVIADAIIDYSWLENHIDQTEDIALIANVCSNTAWTLNWKGPVYFYTNKDNIETEKELMQISGCKELIPASSNVGNTVVVFTVQVMGYDQYLLIGYDYGWAATDNYYAFKDSDKRYWMKHFTAINHEGRMLDTSQNLHFSCRWIADFFNGMCVPHGIRVYNCSRNSYVALPYISLKRALKMAHRRKISEMERNKIASAFIENRPSPPTESGKNDGMVGAIMQFINPEKLKWIQSL
jgi:hypothetical protein